MIYYSFTQNYFSASLQMLVLQTDAKSKKYNEKFDSKFSVYWNLMKKFIEKLQFHVPITT